MKLPKSIFSVYILALMLVSGCSEEMPVNPDGDTKLTLKVMWTAQDSLFPLTNARVILNSEYGTIVKSTDEEGILVLAKLPSADFNIAVRKTLPDDSSIVIAGTKLNLKLRSGAEIIDTIIAKPVSKFGLAINEIYYAGPVNNQFYFYDQFLELYNASDTVKFLDGVMVMRVTAGDDAGADDDIDGAIYVYRFPGLPGGKEYPIYPKQFITLASDAVNHKNICINSIDLSNADWEFYNQFSPDDIDNPSVPNLRNMVSNKKADFLISLLNDVILVTTGTDSVWIDGIDITSVIDGIEYQSNNSNRKSLDSRVDKGFVVGPARYSGKSIQRRGPGVDTNNGMLDWEILSTPTPGYQ